MTTIKYLDSKRLEQESAYKVHTFTEGGLFTVTGSGDVEYLVVAGGGGASRAGGGAGGYLTSAGHGVTAQNYTITVGTGGNGSLGTSANGVNGSDSIFDTITSTGGGGGGKNDLAGSSGGSGGGGGASGGGSNFAGGSSSPVTSPVQGYAGGTGFSGNSNYPGGAGGGSSAVGGNASSNTVAPSGGAGTSSSITGTSLFYAGGGGGTINSGTGGAGGSGGGGNGGIGVDGSDATGYGSGGGAGSNTFTGGDGSDGIVVIRYLASSSIVATGGTVTVTDGLVAQLKFNDDVTDTYGNNGTVTGTETYVAGKIDKAFSFNGSTEVTLANESNFDFERTDPFSIAFWVNMGNNTNKMLMCKGDDPYSSGTTSGISIWTQADYLDVNINASASQFIRVRTAIASIEDSTWHHVTVSYDGSSTASGLTIYYDGVSQSLSTVSDTLTSSSILNNYPFLIGDSGAGSKDWTGKLDDLRIYSRELDQSEVTMIYNGGTGTESESPSSVQDNSILVEKYTGKRFWFDEAFTPSITFTDTFQNNTGWTFVPSSGSNISVSGGEVYANTVTADGDNRIHKPLGFTLEDQFVARWTHIPKGVSNNNVYMYVMNFTAGTGNFSTSINQDSIYLLTDSSSQNLMLRSQDGTTTGSVSNTQGLTTDQGYYLTLVKDRSSGTVYVRSGSHTGTLVNTLTTTFSSGITGLTHVQTGAITGGNAGTGSYKIENLQIYNGVTSIDTIPASWNSRFRGIFAGGSDVNGNTSTMEYISIASPSNASAFGNLSQPLNHFASVHSDVRGVFCGGISSANTDAMEYITIATLGNTSPFGTLNATMRTINGVSSDVRGIIGGGDVNTTQYITIATLGNGLNFGNITTARKQMAGVSSDVRGIFAGGGGAAIAVSNEMDYFTIPTASTAGDFGDLSVARKTLSGINSDVRGVFCGGSYLTICDYVTIATEGNATTFGDLSQSSYGGYGVSSDVRGVVTLGWTVNAESSKLDYITIPTLGNSNNFGDLSVSKIYESGVSGQ